MLTEERHALIVKSVNEKHSMKIGELCELLDASEATVRRDLTELAKKKLIVKVHGGAIAVTDNYSQVEWNMEEKETRNRSEKEAIAKYAASLIEDGDCVYLDAGTTTQQMIDFLSYKNVTFVTNGFTSAKKLAQKGFMVYLPGGSIKPSTEAIIGSECVESLSRYNFTKCFIGTNGISLSAGFTTPDKNEAMVKSTAIAHSKDCFILADHSKFDHISFATFASLDKATVITDQLPDKRYQKETMIVEVH